MEGCTELHRSQGTGQQATKEEVPVITRALRVAQMETQPARQSGGRRAETHEEGLAPRGEGGWVGSWPNREVGAAPRL